MSAEQEQTEKMEEAVRTLLLGMGENPDRPDLKDTPKRFVKALLSFSPNKEAPEVTLFENTSKGIVSIKNLEVRSLCGHHLFPFFGDCVVSYIPDKSKAGISKMQRVLDYVANKPQDQENLTKELLDYLVDKIQPKAMAVRMICKHTCMTVRGVKCHDAQTSTTETYYNQSAGVSDAEFSLMLSELN